MKSFTVNLTKEDTLIIKGIAIITIVLHNYFHIFNGVVRENEFGYCPDNFLILWSSLQNSFLHFFVNFISMYGHYGVVAFFFVSGYGLAKKYKDRELERDFIIKNAIKLWKLFVPILICFVGLAIIKAFIINDFIDASKHIGVVLCKALSRILFISNFSVETVFWISGPWWFFSAIFQMYVLHKFVFSKILSSGWLSVIALLMVIIQLFYYLNNPDISLMRYNAPAWIPAFILGIILAKHEIKLSVFVMILLSVACFIIDYSFITWIFGYSMFVFAFILLLYIMKNTMLKDFFIKTGELSAYLFVTNTFVRTFFNTFVCKPEYIQPVWLIVITGVIHLVLCFFIAILYKKLNVLLLLRIDNIFLYKKKY